MPLQQWIHHPFAYMITTHFIGCKQIFQLFLNYYLLQGTAPDNSKTTFQHFRRRGRVFSEPPKVPLLEPSGLGFTSILPKLPWRNFGSLSSPDVHICQPCGHYRPLAFVQVSPSTGVFSLHRPKLVYIIQVIRHDSFPVCSTFALVKRLSLHFCPRLSISL